MVLSHADIAHTGALPYAVAKLGLKYSHIYCTLPVQHLGHLALYEFLASRHDVSNFEEFTYDDIDVAFEAIQGVRFGQQVNISAGVHSTLSVLQSHDHGRFRAWNSARMFHCSCDVLVVRGAGGAGPVQNVGQGAPSSPADMAESAAARHTLQITAFAAGHSLGGAVWQLSLMDQDFVYAVCVNLKQDMHLKGCSIHMVCDLHFCGLHQKSFHLATLFDVQN